MDAEPERSHCGVPLLPNRGCPAVSTTAPHRGSALRAPGQTDGGRNVRGSGGGGKPVPTADFYSSVTAAVCCRARYLVQGPGLLRSMRGRRQVYYTRWGVIKAHFHARRLSVILPWVRRCVWSRNLTTFAQRATPPPHPPVCEPHGAFWTAHLCHIPEIVRPGLKLHNRNVSFLTSC